MFRKLFCALALLAFGALDAQAATIAITQGAGTNMLTKQDGASANASTVTLGDATNPDNAAPVDATKGLMVQSYGTGCAGATIANTVYTPINTTASAQLIAGTAAQKLHICLVNLVVATADNVAVVEGTGATCGTGTAGVMGGATAATGWNLGANGQVAIGNGHDELTQVATTADNLCLLVSGAAQVSGFIVTASY